MIDQKKLNKPLSYNPHLSEAFTVGLLYLAIQQLCKKQVDNY